MKPRILNPVSVVGSAGQSTRKTLDERCNVFSSYSPLHVLRSGSQNVCYDKFAPWLSEKSASLVLVLDFDPFAVVLMWIIYTCIRRYSMEWKSWIVDHFDYFWWKIALTIQQGGTKSKDDGFCVLFVQLRLVSWFFVVRLYIWQFCGFMNRIDITWRYRKHRSGTCFCCRLATYGALKTKPHHYNKCEAEQCPRILDFYPNHDNPFRRVGAPAIAMGLWKQRWQIYFWGEPLYMLRGNAFFNTMCSCAQRFWCFEAHEMRVSPIGFNGSGCKMTLATNNGRRCWILYTFMYRKIYCVWSFFTGCLRCMFHLIKTSALYNAVPLKYVPRQLHDL